MEVLNYYVIENVLDYEKITLLPGYQSAKMTMKKENEEYTFSNLWSQKSVHEEVDNDFLFKDNDLILVNLFEYELIRILPDKENKQIQVIANKFHEEEITKVLS